MVDGIVGIDLGGTRIKGVCLDSSGKLIGQHYWPTNDVDDAGWKNTVKDAVEDVRDRYGLSHFSIGISAPGIPDPFNKAIAHMPGRLKGLENFDWSVFLDRDTWVLNDAIAALVAELKLGVARNRRNAIMLTLGTGVGGAILIDGKPYQGSFQKAGHIGHIAIDHESDCDVTGMPGSLEDAIGNCTIHKRSLGRFSDTHTLLEAYRQGDYFAQWIWLSSIRKLAIGIASTINVLSPECIILGGGITGAGKDLFEPLESFLSLYEWRVGGGRCEIVKAHFGDMAGAVGAACFALKEDGPQSSAE